MYLCQVSYITCPTWTPYYVKTIDDVIHVPKVSGASNFSILNTRSVGSGK